MQGTPSREEILFVLIVGPRFALWEMPLPSPAGPIRSAVALIPGKDIFFTVMEYSIK